MHGSGDEASSMHITYIPVIDYYPPHHSHCNVYFRKYIRDGSRISLRGGGLHISPEEDGTQFAHDLCNTIMH